MAKGFPCSSGRSRHAYQGNRAALTGRSKVDRLDYQLHNLMSVIRQELFRSLPQYEPSFRALAASVTAHILAAAILVLLPLVFIEQAPEQALAIVHLVAPGVLPPAMMSPPRQEVVHLALPRTEPEPPEPKEIAPREVRVEPKAPLEPPPI